MNNQKRAGIITALIGLVALIVLLNASTSAPIINWPMEAYLGTVFTIGWMTGVPDFLAYILAIVVFVVVIGVCYKLGSWLYDLVVGRS
ncbi:MULTISPECIES: hypothetical protein [Psychrobacter]|jgi:hypothetical protein|uniref:hypothetical protein n=1 Tax=Psychrobacter TaxID=497 RepID=UPI0004215847|nr:MULTISPECIES: hypothetical protein [Psychrobacter]MCG3882472.1 hypothetical protein [Psychrobacter sp. Ps3]HAM61198.1 hypothetical protein [Psychrobacter sp.]|tara:strand:+ start:497 stop:760 length:264 start_codon:yes stop_codon:yes gene_type:complete